MNKHIPGDPFAYRGQHRKPRSRYAVKVAALAVPMTLAGLAVVGSTPLAAHAAVTNATPAQKAYAAFTTWEQHRTRVNLDKLVTASFNLPARYDAADIGQLYADVMGGAKKADIARDVAYVDQDLTQLMLPMAS